MKIALNESNRKKSPKQYAEVVSHICMNWCFKTNLLSNDSLVKSGTLWLPNERLF